MQVTKIRCWHVPEAIYDPDQVTAWNPTLDLLKKSILETEYRAHCLDDRSSIESGQRIGFIVQLHESPSEQGVVALCSDAAAPIDRSHGGDLRLRVPADIVPPFPPQDA